VTVRTVSRCAVLHRALSFPSAMQTRFRSEEKRSGYIRKQKTLPKYRRFSMVCIRRIGNGSAGAKSARRLTWLCKAEGKRSRSRAEFAAETAKLKWSWAVTVSEGNCDLLALVWRMQYDSRK